MAEGSGVTFVFEESDLPLLPDALELCGAGMIPVAASEIASIMRRACAISDEVSEQIAELAFDPQTSGGLLIAVPDADALALLVELQKSGHREAAIVGRVTTSADFPIELV